MSWLVEDVVRRWRSIVGQCSADDWQVFVDRIGVRVEFDELPDSVPAFIDRDVIVVQRGLLSDQTSGHVWHEIGHRALHAGTRSFWMSRPQGYITIAKFERQANEFAASFPIWED